MVGSPLLLQYLKNEPKGKEKAHLFLHYAFDKWLEQKDKKIQFTRYADDVIVHCKSKVHSEQLLKSLHQWMDSVGLELHPQKTKIVYCQDYRTKGKQIIVKFDFLGYSFQPRAAYSQRGNLFIVFDCAISISSRKRIAKKLEELNLNKTKFQKYRRCSSILKSND
jgi:RNA-directed DNA polymerase